MIRWTIERFLKAGMLLISVSTLCYIFYSNMVFYFYLRNMQLYCRHGIGIDPLPQPPANACTHPFYDEWPYLVSVVLLLLGLQFTRDWFASPLNPQVPKVDAVSTFRIAGYGG